MENYHQSSHIDNEAERLRLINLTGNLASKATFTRLMDKGYSPATILDAGCGTGDAFDVIHKAFPAAKIIGVDQSDKVVEIARSKGNVSKVIIGNVARLSSHDEVQQAGPFDMIFVRNTLLHIPNVSAALSEMMQVANSGGVVVGIEPDWEAASANWSDFAIFKQAMTTAMQDHGINPFLGQSLKQLFIQAGFEDITKVVYRYKTESDDEGWKVLGYLLDVSASFITPYLQKLGIESVDLMKQMLQDSQKTGNYFYTPSWVAVVGKKPVS